MLWTYETVNCVKVECLHIRLSISFTLSPRQKPELTALTLSFCLRTVGSYFNPRLKSPSSPSSMLSHWYRQASVGGRQDLKETHQRVTTTPQIFSGTHPLCTGGYNTQINISSHFPHNTSLTSHNRTTNTKVFTTTLSVINSPIMLCLIWWCRGENTTLDFETEASSCESQEFHSSTRFISADICSVQE